MGTVVWALTSDGDLGIRNNVNYVVEAMRANGVVERLAHSTGDNVLKGTRQVAVNRISP